MKSVLEIPGEEFERTIQAAAKPVLVHFCTSWCGRCQILAPALAVLAAELQDELQVAELNLDHCPELTKHYGVTEVPTLILFDNGTPIVWLDTWMPLRQMRAHLQGVLADYAAHPKIAVAP